MGGGSVYIYIPIGNINNMLYIYLPFYYESYAQSNIHGQKEGTNAQNQSELKQL